jgi:hypothetical protein
MIMAKLGVAWNLASGPHRQFVQFARVSRPLTGEELAAAGNAQRRQYVVTGFGDTHDEAVDHLEQRLQDRGFLPAPPSEVAS